MMLQVPTLCFLGQLEQIFLIFHTSDCRVLPALPGRLHDGRGGRFVERRVRQRLRAAVRLRQINP